MISNNRVNFLKYHLQTSIKLGFVAVKVARSDADLFRVRVLRQR